jgi:hypothetical protein
MAAHEQKVTAKSGRGPKTHHWLLTLLVLVALVVAGRWWLQHRQAAPLDTQRTDAQVAQDKAKARELLDKANAALRAGRITEPPGDNALEYYKAALTIDPKSQEVKEELQKIGSELVSRFEEVMKSGQVDEAEKALASLKKTIPEDAHIAAMQLRLLSAQVSKAVSDGKLDRAKDLVQRAEHSGAVAAEQLKKWEEDIRAAAKSSSSKSSSSPTQ